MVGVSSAAPQKTVQTAKLYPSKTTIQRSGPKSMSPVNRAAFAGRSCSLDRLNELRRSPQVDMNGIFKKLMRLSDSNLERVGNQADLVSNLAMRSVRTSSPKRKTSPHTHRSTVSSRARSFSPSPHARSFYAAYPRTSSENNRSLSIAPSSQRLGLSRSSSDFRLGELIRSRSSLLKLNQNSELESLKNRYQAYQNTASELGMNYYRNREQTFPLNTKIGTRLIMLRVRSRFMFWYCKNIDFSIVA